MKCLAPQQPTAVRGVLLSLRFYLEGPYLWVRHGTWILLGQPSASHWAPTVIAAVQQLLVAPVSFDASVLGATAEV